MKILVPCSYYVFGWNRGGIFSTAKHFKRIFDKDCDLIKFGSLKEEKTTNELPYATITDFSSYDCTFLPDVRGFSGLKENLDLSKFPRPIVARVDDYGDTDFKNLKQWSKDIDVFWCFKNKLYDYVRQNTDKKVVISGLPYYPAVPLKIDVEEKTIVSVCRLDPIKRIETLIDVASKVDGKIILWLYTMDFLRNYSKTMESLIKEQFNIEYRISDFPFEEKSIFEILSMSNSYYNATTWGSGTSEYVALEAMNNLCVPVIRSNMRSDYNREGYKALFWEYHEDLIKAIERSFVDHDMLNDNLENLQTNRNNFKNILKEIVNDWHL